MGDKLSGMIDIPKWRGEVGAVTVDTTANPTRPLVGQLRRNRRKKENRDQERPYSQQLHAVQVVRGAPCSVLLAGPMFSGYVPAAGALYAQKFSDRQRNEVLHSTADNANAAIEATISDDAR